MGFLRFAASDAGAHFGVGLQIAQLVVIHHANAATAKGLADGERDFSFGGDHLGAVFRHHRDHFLFTGDRHGATLFSLGLGDFLLRFGLIGL